MIKCPNPECGHENVDGTQFCEVCGEELPQGGAGATAAAPVVAAVGSAAPAADGTGDLIRCPACDNFNPADNAVCEVCGTELHPGRAPAATASTADTTVDTTVTAVPVPLDATITSTPVTPVPSIDDPFAAGTAPDVAATTGEPTVGVTAPDAGVAGVGATTGDEGVVDTPLGNPVVGAVATSSVAPDTASTTDTLIAGAPVASVTPVAGGANLQPGQVKLTVEQGMTVGKQFVLGDPEILVGREDDEEQIYPDIDLSDQDEGYVHRKHATLRFENGGLTVTHLGGANKTRLNNRPLPDNEPQPVNIGDKIAFGKVVMRVGSV